MTRRLCCIDLPSGPLFERTVGFVVAVASSLRFDFPPVSPRYFTAETFLSVTKADVRQPACCLLELYFCVNCARGNANERVSIGYLLVGVYSRGHAC